MRKLLIAICLLSVATFSCRKKNSISYEYNITNTCDTSITVEVRYPADTTIIIHKGTTKRIHFTFLQQRQKSPSFRELSNDFDTIIVRKYHIASQHDYMKKEKWTFVKFSDVLGTYTATVSNAEF